MSIAGKVRTTVHKEDRLWWCVTVVCFVFIIDTSIHWATPATPVAGWSQETVRDPLILVLNYDRIDERCSDEICTSTAQLKSHIEQLKVWGFEAIKLEDLVNFYYDGSQLPKKSVMLTFKHGYLSTYESVHPILSEIQWPAVMDIEYGKISMRNTFFLYWGRLNKMVQSGLWDFSVSGFSNPDRNIRSAQKTEQTSEANSLASLALPKDLLENAVARINSNLTHISSEISGYRVHAFDNSRDTLMGVSSKEALEERFKRSAKTNRYVSFSNDDFGINTALTKPSSVNRLAVPTGISRETFAALVEKGTKSPTVTGHLGLISKNWKVTEGEINFQNNHYFLQGKPQTQMWTPAGPYAANWKLSSSLSLDNGEFWIVQKSTTDDSFVRFGGDEKSLHLQIRENSSTVTNLRSIPYGATKGLTHTVTIVKRGSGIWVEFNGKLIFEHPVSLPEVFQGHIGWMTWNKPGKNSQLELWDTSFEVLPNVLHILSPNPSVEEVQNAQAVSDMTTHLSHVQWFVEGSKSWPVEEKNLFYKIAPDYYGLGFVPSICILSPKSENVGARKFTSRGAWKKELLRLLKTLEYPTVYLIFDEKLADKLADNVSEIENFIINAQASNSTPHIWVSHLSNNPPGLRIVPHQNVCESVVNSNNG